MAETKGSGAVSAAEAAKEEGNTFLMEKKYTEAIAAYTKGLEAKADHPILFANRAQAHLMKKEYSAAIRDARCCVTHDPEYAKGWYRMSQALLGVGQAAEAKAAAEKGASLAKDSQSFTPILSRCERILTSKHLLQTGVPELMQAPDEIQRWERVFGSDVPIGPCARKVLASRCLWYSLMCEAREKKTVGSSLDSWEKTLREENPLHRPGERTFLDLSSVRAYVRGDASSIPGWVVKRGETASKADTDDRTIKKRDPLTWMAHALAAQMLDITALPVTTATLEALAGMGCPFIRVIATVSEDGAPGTQTQLDLVHAEGIIQTIAKERVTPLKLLSWIAAAGPYLGLGQNQAAAVLATTVLTLLAGDDQITDAPVPESKEDENITIPNFPSHRIPVLRELLKDTGLEPRELLIHLHKIALRATVRLLLEGLKRSLISVNEIPGVPSAPKIRKIVDSSEVLKNLLKRNEEHAQAIIKLEERPSGFAKARFGHALMALGQYGAAREHLVEAVRELEEDAALPRQVAEIELSYASAVGSLGERIPLADVRNHFVMYRSLRNAAEKLYGAAYPASSPFATEVTNLLEFHDGELKLEEQVKEGKYTPASSPPAEDPFDPAWAIVEPIVNRKKTIEVMHKEKW